MDTAFTFILAVASGWTVASIACRQGETERAAVVRAVIRSGYRLYLTHRRI
jgi:hypothetical protein